MGKDVNKFYEDYKKYRDNLKNSNGKTDVEACKKGIIADFALDYMFEGFFTNVFRKNESGNPFDVIMKISDNSLASNDVILRSIGAIAVYFKEKNPEIKKLIDDAVANYKPSEKDKEGKDISGVLKEINDAIKNCPDKDTVKKFYSRLEQNFKVDLKKDSLGDKCSFYDRIFEIYPPAEDLIIDDQKYTSLFDAGEAGYDHPYDEAIDNYLGEQEKKGSEDKELENALKGSKKILADAERQGEHLSHVAEKTSEMSFKVFDIGYKEFLAEKNMDFANTFMDTHKTDENYTDEIVDYKNRNIKGLEYKPSGKFVTEIKNMIAFIREKGLNNGVRLSDVMDKSSKKLITAIQNKNDADIKKYYKETAEKIKNADYVIGKLKSIDDKHYFSSNFACSRERTFPAKYRLDIEGATLFNQLLNIDMICSKNNISVDEFFAHPENVMKQSYEKFLSDNSNSFYAALRGQPLPDLLEVLYGGELEHEIDIRVGNDFEQVVSALCINNPGNRYECYQKVNTEFKFLGMALDQNGMNITNAGKDLNKLSYEIAPAMIFLGDKFNPYKHINPKEGIIDFNGGYRKKFVLKDYIRDNLSVKDVLETIGNAKTTLDESNGHRMINVLSAGFDEAKVQAKEALKEKQGIRSITAEKMVDYYANGKTGLTPMQLRTFSSELDFAGISVKGINKDNLAQATEKIAALQKSYDSHNGLAKLLFPKLRDQKEALEKMKKAVTDTGVSRTDLDNVINSINGNLADKDEKLNNMVTKEAVKDVENKTVSSRHIEIDELDESVIEDVEIIEEGAPEVQNEKVK